MNNPGNLRTYRLWAPIYDWIMRPVYQRARRRSLAVLDPRPGERVLIPGIGTGLDLPLLPDGVIVTGVDLSPAMLDKARAKIGGRDVTLLEQDASRLPLADASHDAVICHLVLSVVPDGKAVLYEAWRVLRPGGRVVIFDKFLPPQAALTPRRRLIGRLVRLIGTDVNRRLDEMLDGLEHLSLERDEPSLLGGQYRIVLLRKSARATTL